MAIESYEQFLQPAVCDLDVGRVLRACIALRADRRRGTRRDRESRCRVATGPRLCVLIESYVKLSRRRARSAHSRRRRKSLGVRPVTRRKAVAKLLGAL